AVCLSGLALGEVLEAVEVDGARVAGYEAEALLPLDPGLHLDPVVGRHATAAGDVLFVGEVAVVGVGVVVLAGRVLDHRDDADLVAAQIPMFVAVVGGDRAERLLHRVLRVVGLRRVPIVRTYRRRFANSSRRFDAEFELFSGAGSSRELGQMWPPEVERDLHVGDDIGHIRDLADHRSCMSSMASRSATRAASTFTMAVVCASASSTIFSCSALSSLSFFSFTRQKAQPRIATNP